MGMQGDNIDVVYRYMKSAFNGLEGSGLETKQKEELEEYLETKIGQFEEAALSLIFDRRTFFTKTKFGNPGTISEFVGDMVMSSLIAYSKENPSPNMLSGKIAWKIMPHIEYDSIVSGEIKFGNQRYTRNGGLVNLLFHMQTETIPGIDYWENIAKNEDFVVFYYKALKLLNSPDAKGLIPNVVAAHFKNYGKELRFSMTHTLKNEFGNPWGDFLDANKPKNYFGNKLTEAGIKKAPETIKILNDGQVIILSSYKSQDSQAHLRIVHIDERVNEFSFVFNHAIQNIPNSIPQYLRSDILNMITGFQTTTEKYREYLISSEIKN